MKRPNSTLKNENLIATLVIGAVFLITAAFTVFAMMID